ncbi:MAG: histidinol-phosphate transaminase [Clostridia bacterium]|nr:histidinol-phosphate transaminase [Clostridia bacterium]
MSRFLDEKFSGLKEYVPGEQPRDKKYIKLNTNESPFPPSDSVLEAVNSEEVKNLRLYSDPSNKALKEKLAEIYEVTSDNIYVSNGSDDILNFAFMAFGDRGAAFPDITYGFYKVFAKLYVIDTQIIPLEEDFSIDENKYFGLDKLIVIANPNAPTGLSLSLDKIEKIVSSNKNSVVLIDEAYVDFGGESCYELIDKYDNLLVVRTFSKSRSLAGARLGFAIASKEIIKDLEKLKFSTNPYDINRLTQAAGVAALNQDDYYTANCKKIIENREFTANALKEMGFSVIDSDANFLFVKSDKISGLDFYLKLKEKGVLIRHFTDERICEYNRVTIGSREEMEIFLEKTAEILN